jgi:hypothetical protein
MYRPTCFAILVATISCSIAGAQDSYSNPQVISLSETPQAPVVQLEYPAATHDAGTVVEAPSVQYQLAEPCNCSECAAAASPATSAKKNDKPKPTCAKSHKVLFYANDFSYLSNKDYSDNCLGDSLKQMSVGRNGELDIGGQLRYRYHSEFGMGRQAGAVGFQDTQNDFGLIRARLYANYQMNDIVRLYAEGI